MKNPRIDKSLLVKIPSLLEPLFVYAGVVAAMTSFCREMELNLVTGSFLTVLLIACYGLFFVYRYLDAMPGGRLMGFMAVVVLEVVFFVRFFTPMVKGAQYAVNSFLKQLMEYSDIKLDLISYISSEKVYLEEYCLTLFFTALGVLIIAIIQFTFFTKRRILPFFICTIPFVLLPIIVGNTIPPVAMTFYLLVAVVMAGTRFKKGQEFENALRSKVTFILCGCVILCGLLSLAVVTSHTNEKSMTIRSEAKDVLMDMLNYSPLKLDDWFRANFSSDAIGYGDITASEEVNYTGKVILKAKNKEGLVRDIYLKSFVGDKIIDNQWVPFNETDGRFVTERSELLSEGIDSDNTTNKLVSKINENRTFSHLTMMQTMKIKNVAFGKDNRVLPYCATARYQYGQSGKLDLDTLTVYEVSYYKRLADYLLNGNNTMLSEVRNSVAVGMDLKYSSDMDKIREFVRKYYLDIPEKYSNLCDEFFNIYNDGVPFYAVDSNEKYLGDLEVPKGYTLKEENGVYWSPITVAHHVKEYLANTTSYTLSPGATPEGEDALLYFLNTSKKGYCVHYASAATMLFRHMGVPARYVEWTDVYSKEFTKKYIKIRDWNAHAWVEIFLDDIGWIPVEVTPGGVVESGEVPEGVEAPEDFTEETTDPDASATPETTDSPEITATPEATEGPLEFATVEPEEDLPQEVETPEPEEELEFEDTDEGDFEEESESEEESDGTEGEDDGEGGNGSSEGSMDQEEDGNGTPWYAIVIPLLLVLSIPTAFLLRQRWYRNDLMGAKKRNRIIKMFLHMHPLLTKFGLHYKGQATKEYIELLAKESQLKEEGVAPFVRILFKAEFGGGDISGEEYKEFCRAYRKIFNSLKNKLSVPQKILFVLLHGKK